MYVIWVRDGFDSCQSIAIGQSSESDFAHPCPHVVDPLVRLVHPRAALVLAPVPDITAMGINPKKKARPEILVGKQVTQERFEEASSILEKDNRAVFGQSGEQQLQGRHDGGCLGRDEQRRDGGQRLELPVHLNLLHQPRLCSVFMRRQPAWLGQQLRLEPGGVYLEPVVLNRDILSGRRIARGEVVKERAIPDDEAQRVLRAASQVSCEECPDGSSCRRDALSSSSDLVSEPRRTSQDMQEHRT